MSDRDYPLSLEADDAPIVRFSNVTKRYGPLTVLDSLDLDASFYYVDRLAALDISSCVRLEGRIAWRPLGWLELSLVGRNLLEASHAEFASHGSKIATKPQRDVYFETTIRTDLH